MATEINERIRTKTQGRKSLRDGLRALLEWSACTQKAFEIEEMAGVLSNATRVGVHDILDRWMAPQPVHHG